MKTFAIAAVGMMTALGGVAETRAADAHLNDLAFQVRSQSATLLREIRYGYRYHPEFGHLYEDALEMCRHADAIYSITHFRGTEARLAAEVNALDELFHHVEEVVAAADATGAHRINAFHQRRACAVLRVMEDTIHHLLDDLTPVAPVVPVAPVRPVVPVIPARPVLPPTPVFHQPTPVRYEVRPFGGRLGFTYRSRNGRFSITVGR